MVFGEGNKYYEVQISGESREGAGKKKSSESCIPFPHSVLCITNIRNETLFMLFKSIVVHVIVDLLSVLCSI